MNSQTEVRPVRVKICGITSTEDAALAVDAGADAIGLVFYPDSPRHVDIETAAAIASSVGPFVTVVGLFVNAEAEFIERVLDSVGLHVLQFHGGESEDFCKSFRRPYLKALRMKADIDIEAEMNRYPGAAGILLDAYRKGVPGGTGETFDWQRIPPANKHIVLAGGLKPSNIIEAVSLNNVYAVDVSGGVESEPGKKDHQKLTTFIRRAKTARP